MTSYKHKGYELVMDGARGTIYKNNQLMFRGFSYYAMKQFIHLANNPEVTEWFRPQLDMREKCRFTRTEKQADDS